ncbi:HK97-gp10 family putative phage morphogenesis protein [Singulisphaera sp. PoT]|uniref:HK97-gp10 family putative phage morphogenesis protein n=1 Tax=Singulisphaera sp. PoT TaxID=3411797 RepID=UPI003BF5887D
MTIRFTVEGVDELKRKLAALPTALVDREIPDALNEALKPVRDEAKSIAGRGSRASGHTASLIEIRPVEDHKTNVVTAEVALPKATPKELSVAIALEQGTRHRPAKPFMRPALDSKQAEAVRIFGRRVRAAVERLMNK